MSEDIRKMIDKVKNFKQFVNESVHNENIIFVRTKNFDNTGTVNNHTRLFNFFKEPQKLTKSTARIRTIKIR